MGPGGPGGDGVEVRRVVHGGDDTWVGGLPGSAGTTAPGRYSIWFSNGTGHACIGEIVSTDASAGTVTRLVERVDSGDLQNAKTGMWSGYV